MRQSIKKPVKNYKIMKIKILTLLILAIISCGSNYKTENKNPQNENSQKLIGTWEFIETRDSSGKKLESYQGSFGTVQATGPKLIYNKNYTYTKVFTPVNSDNGFWKFNSETSTIEHDLYVDSLSPIFPYLLKDNLIEKKRDGNYYELIEDKIIKIEGNEMLLNNRGLIDVYKKTK